MGRPGRKPKSAVLKILEGNPSKTPILPDLPAAGKAKMPGHLSIEGKAVWKRIVSSMPEGFYKLADSETLAAYCEAAAEHKRATVALQSPEIDIWEHTKGRVHPARRNQQSAARLIAQLGTRLNLSPGDRAQSVKNHAEVSKWAGLIG